MQVTWNQLTQGHNFITDLGEIVVKAGVKAQRYAVWIPDKEQSDRHRIAEVGNDLDSLSDKYKVKAEYIFRVEQ